MIDFSDLIVTVLAVLCLVVILWGVGLADVGLRIPGALVIGERETYDTYATNPVSSRYGGWIGGGPLGFSNLGGTTLNDQNEEQSMNNIFNLPQFTLIDSSGLQRIRND